MAGLDEPNFDLFTAFKLDSRKRIIGFLFCRLDEAHTSRMENEKIATFCSLAKKDRCLMT